MKIGVCCIVKQENLYLRDWVEYYKNMGVSNIILYDNNDELGEYPQQVIGDFVDSGFVIYKDVRGKHRYQLEAYTECYREYRGTFDWVAFLDCDEFWYLEPYYTFDTFLTEERFPNAMGVCLYWLCYGDCDKLHYENKPVWERFTVPSPPKCLSRNVFINSVSKLVLKCRTDIDIKFIDANWANYIYYGNNPDYKLYRTSGENCWPDIYKTEYANSYIKHYRTLTIEEFLYRRFGRRGYADKASPFKKDEVLKLFFDQNEWTQEKQDIIDNFFKKFTFSEDDAEI